MNKFRISLLLRILLWSSLLIMVFSISAVAATNKQTVLSQKQEITLPIAVFDGNSKWSSKKAMFRTDGDYEWKWTIADASYFTFPIEGSNVYYLGSHNMNYAVNSQGERTWMFNESRDMNLTQLESGRLLKMMIDHRSTDEIEGEEKTNYYSPGRATVIDYKGKEIFTISLIADNSYISPAYLEDSRGNLIIHQEDGIASYDKSGNKNWLYQDGITIKSDPLSSYSSNIVSMGINLNGMITVRTSNHLLTLSLDGKLIASNPYKLLQYKYKDNSTVNLIVNADGLVEIDNNKLVTPEEAADYNLKWIEDFMKVKKEIHWLKGTYVFSDGSTIQSKDLQGKVKWTYKLNQMTYELKNYAPPGSGVVDSEGNLIFSDKRGNIYGLDSMGNEKFQFKSHTHVSSLFLDNQGDIYGVNSNQGLFRISKRHENVIINGKPIVLEHKPVIKSSTFLVPYRSLFKGLNFSVEMDSSNKWTIGKSSSGKSIRFQAGNRNMEINGKFQKLPVAPEIIGGVTYIPLQSISQMLGLRMEWDKLRNEVYLGADKQLVIDTVRRFLLQVEHGQELLANDLLDIKGKTLGEIAPALIPEYRSDKWVIDIKSIKATKITNNEYQVVAIQHNQKFDRDDSIDVEKSYVYQVKLRSDGRWRITSSDFITDKYPR